MTIQRVPVTGGCLCGAVRYESKEPPTGGGYCHCRICQRSGGGLFNASVSVPGPAFRFTKGKPRYYRASSFAKRGFCVECGSPIVFFYEGNPHVWIKIGSLDHPEDWPMTKEAAWGRSTHAHTDSKIPWYEIRDGLPQSTSAWAEVVAAMNHVARTVRITKSGSRAEDPPTR
jgi:hypothetical protein